MLKSMKERRKAVTAKARKAQTSNNQELDEGSDESWIDVNSQDEEENPTVWIKEAEGVFEEREEAETERAEVPAEAPQRRTSTRVRKPTKLFGSGVHIDFVNDGDEEESEASKRLEIPEDLKRKIVENASMNTRILRHEKVCGN